MKDCTTDLEKVQSIYRWTQDNIKYIAFEKGLGGFIPRSGAVVCEKRYGDCKDMASIIHEMTSLVGVETSLVWIGSRDIPYTYEELSTPSVDNHMIAAYKHENDWIFLDATGSDQYFGQPTSFIQGKQALIRISDEEYELATVPVAKPSENTVHLDANFSIEDGTLKGDGEYAFTGYYSVSLNGMYEYLDHEDKDDFLKEYLSFGNNKCKIEDPTLEQKEDLRGVNCGIGIELPDYALEVEDELIINLNVEKPYSGSSLEKDRELPLEFEYLSTYSNEIALDIPEGYELSFVPENFDLDNELFKCFFTYEVKDNKVIFSHSAELKELILYPEHFELWNSTMKTVKKEYKKALVLKRI
ncbi:MAG: hypothetical protein HRT74_01305 [Flavobacteriales bacterium]|nr:hypothetical protein [Flavobacteriales bacterium]